MWTDDLISKCCMATVRIEGDPKEGTMYYVCTNCNNPCDTVTLITRPSWDSYFIKMAEHVATRSTCLRRQIGCIIVKEKRILATGYNGAPSGLKHCSERGGCWRERNKIPSGERQEKCMAVHSEVNAICQAAKFGIRICGADLYCTNLPCITCAKAIIQCKIKNVYYKGDYPDIATTDLFNEANINLLMFP